MPATEAAPVVIAVDGRSGSGKTTLAVELAARLREHHTVSLFHLEDLYPGWDGLLAGMEHYVSNVLTPLRSGNAAVWTPWNWGSGTPGPPQTMQGTEIIVVEGVGAGCAAAEHLVDAIIWLDAPPDRRRERALQRDGDTYAPHWERWAGQEDLWLAADDVAARADITLSGPETATSLDEVMAALASLPRLAPLLERDNPRNRTLRITAERVEARIPPEQLFQSLYGAASRAVWLDSSNADSTRPPDRNAYSIMADDGGRFGRYASHRSGLTRVEAGGMEAGGVTTRIRGPFFRWLDSAWTPQSLPLPDGVPGEFGLGWLGYLGYELKRETGGRDVAGDYDDAALIFAGRAVVVDHAGACLWLLALTDDSPGRGTQAEIVQWRDSVRAAIDAAEDEGTATAEATPPTPAADSSAPTAAPDFRVRDHRDDYLDKIAEAKQEIREGNSYEICLTTALEARSPAPVEPLAAYLALRRRNPAPFASYLRFGNLAAASTSPERFLRIGASGEMRAEPIKGTRRRGADPQADAALREDLASSLKDRAENVMIVDLLRNDLSHFAVPGSLRVSRLCAIESYATVHQMVSTIEAQLRPEASRAEAVATAFPAGSMTGAPKISTMNILDRLESGPRGIYSGAVGYFSLTGAADLSVVIRTLVMQTNGSVQRLSLGVGGAITADSVPEAEWDEVRAKAFGVLSALGAEFPAEITESP